LESLKKMFPEDKLWPINEFWDFHCGRNEFNKLTRYLNAFDHRYGEATSIEEFAFKAQAANYEGIRAMFESFSVNLPDTTGIIQWMLNASWPKLYWQLYDYNLEPGGVFFGAKKGAAPVAAIYNYGNNSVYAVNQGHEVLNDAKINITAYDLYSNKILERTVSANCATGTSTKVFSLAGLISLTPVYFLEMNLQDSSGVIWARNFYWLSTTPDVLDEGKTEWYVTPNKSFADFTALKKLPEANVAATVDFQHLENLMTRAVVTLTNESDHLAFFIEMRVVGDKSQETLLPVYWDDNYVSLPPHASRAYVALIPPSNRRENPELRVQGWNVKAETISAER
jgi:exo-1,4-beta-D-glucosaminidase